MGDRYAGIDWASEKHDVLVANETGETLLAATFAHDEKGLSALCRTLVRMEVVLVAIERPDGLLVEAAAGRGSAGVAVAPEQVAAARDRFRVSGGKSDRFDAFVLCELARTDHHRFRVLEPDSDQTKALRALTRAREDLVGARTAVVNQLRAELERFWPGPLRSVQPYGQRDPARVPERYPSPPDARGLRVARMQAFLERERYSGRQHPTALMAKLRSAPQGRVGELELAARRQLVLTFVATIRTLNAQIKDLERQIRTQVRAHPDGVIFLSLFKQPEHDHRRGAAGGIGDCRARYPTRDALAGDAGHAAVSKESGKRKPQRFAGDATNGSGSRSAGSRTAPATGTPGPTPSTPRREHAATNTPARSAPSDAPGAASCGNAGNTAPHTTHHDTERCNATSPSPSPRRRTSCPTSPPPSGRPAPLSPPTGGPPGPSAKRLTASRHPLPAQGG